MERLKDIAQQVALTLKMLFWVAIFCSLFIPAAADYWLP